MSPFNPSGLNRILVIQTASIGDVILATPVVEKLHHFFPGAAIDLLIKQGNEGLFKGHPFLHEVITWDKQGHKLRNLNQLVLRIRGTRYDLVVNIQRFASTGLITALSGAGITIGFDKNPFSFFFTKKIRHRIGPGIHEVQRNLELIREITDDSLQGPRLYPSPIPYPSPYPLPKRGGEAGVRYTISPASLWFTKQFPKERWVELIQRIDPSAAIYLLGSGSDIALCDGIIRDSGHPGAVNLAGRLTFLESAALMKTSKMNFTNDSAPMHLASAVEAPVTVIYCSTIPGFGFGPLSPDSAIVEIEGPLYCRPCGLHGRRACPETHFRCAREIDMNRLAARL
jgi:heptosyltransferase II